MSRLTDGGTPPWRRWAGLTTIAFGGSLLYGTSLAVAIPNWEIWRGALWLTLSAGTGWLLLGPTLIWMTRQRAFALAHACLEAMAIGEGILAIGALLNFIAHQAMPSPALVNIGIVAMSNVAMAAWLSIQLHRIGVPVGKTLAAWLIALDGGGAIAFWFFYHVLLGGRS